MNPYAAPETDAGTPPAPPTRSFALTVSVILAGAGVVVFWGSAIALIAAARNSDSWHAAGMALGGVGLLAVTAHLVGIGVSFAAPRGRRQLGVLANAIPLTVLAALVAFASLRR
jgi:hypothetical protein